MNQFEAISVNPAREFEILKILQDKGLTDWFSIEQFQEAIGVTKYTTVLVIKDSMIKHGILKHNDKKKSGYRLAVVSFENVEFDLSADTPEEVHPTDAELAEADMLDPDLWQNR